MRSTQNLAQITLNEYLVPGDLAIDATIRRGDITRFLASRVGDTGKVLAFSDVKAEIDDVATSLFLSGLHNRVELISKDFSAITNYLEPTTPVAAALFQVDETMDATTLTNTVKMLLMVLKTNGLVLLLSDNPANLVAAQEYVAQLPTDSYNVHKYEDILTGETALLVQRR